MQDNQFLPVGTLIQFGDWEYGWMSTATILGLTPKQQRYRIQIHGAKKPSTLAVSHFDRGYIDSCKGHCPVQIKKNHEKNII